MNHEQLNTFMKVMECGSFNKAADVLFVSPSAVMRQVNKLEEELELMANFNSHALVGIISDWVKNGMRNNYMEYFEKVRMLLEMEYFYLPIKESIFDEKQNLQNNIRHKKVQAIKPVLFCSLI